MQATATVRPPELDGASPTRGLLYIGFLLLGASSSLGRFVPAIGPLTPSFLLGLTLGALGWWRGVQHPVLRQYVRSIVGFAVMAALSLVAANDLGSLLNQTVIVWLLVAPGLAVLLAEYDLLTPMLRGLVFASSVYVAVAVERVLSGQAVLEAGSIQVLGINRNAVDLTVVWLVPVVAIAPSLRLPKLYRLAYIVGTTVYIVNSEGRTGLIALVMVPLLLFGLKPAATRGRRAMRLAAVVVLVGLGAAVLTTTSSSWIPAVGRIQQSQTESRQVGDEVRLLLNRKSVAVAREHPLVGVGLGKFAGTYHPVIEEASTSYIRFRALTAPGHNTFLEILASTGVLGFTFFALAFAVPLLNAARRAFDNDARALAAGLALVIFAISLHTTLGTMPAFPIAVTLAAALRAELRRRDGDEVLVSEELARNGR